MSQKETLAALSQLQLAFRNDFDEVQMDYYVVKLADINPTTLGIAVDQLVNESRFLPTIAEIRAKSQAISNYVNAVDEHETPDEAWSKVQKAIGYGGYDKGLERLDGVVLVVAKRFWRELCYEDNSTQYSVRSKFIEAYKVEVSRTIERDKIQGAIQNVPLMVATREQAINDKLVIEQGNKKIVMLNNGLLKEVVNYTPQESNVDLLEKLKLPDNLKKSLKDLLARAESEADE